MNVIMPFLLNLLAVEATHVRTRQRIILAVAFECLRSESLASFLNVVVLARPSHFLSFSTAALVDLEVLLIADTESVRRSFCHQIV